jgi:hypothetical protein
MLLDIILDTILQYNISLIYVIIFLTENTVGEVPTVIYVIISPFFYWKWKISVVRYSL